jgi:proteasomal ATPase-associated factor 1
VSCGRDGKVKLWDCSTAGCITDVYTASSEIECCDLQQLSLGDVGDHGGRGGLTLDDGIGVEVGTAGKLVVVAESTGQMRAVDLRSRAVAAVCAVGDGVPVTRCCFGLGGSGGEVGGTTAFSGTAGGLVAVWDLRSTDTPLATFHNHDSPVTALTALSRSAGVGAGGGVVAGYEDGVCSVWEHITGTSGGCDGGASGSASSGASSRGVSLSGLDIDKVQTILTDEGKAMVAGADGSIRFYSL